MLKKSLRRPLCITILAGFLHFVATNYAHAANITFLCAEALQSSMQELIPEFERMSGNSVKIVYANIGSNTNRVRKGDEADLAIVSPQQWESLKNEGKIIPEARVVLARIGIGIFVRKGGTRPNIATVEALKRTLLDARSIAVRDPKSGSPVGARTLALFERLGLRDQIMPKIILTEDRPYAAVINGKAEIGFSSMAEIIASPDTDLVGPVPNEVQNFTTFVVALPTKAKEIGAAKTLIEFLTSARATSVFKSKGLDTGP